MSRPIKLTQELIDECRQDFEKALSLTKLSDGKLSFTKAFSCGDRKGSSLLQRRGVGKDDYAYQRVR